MELPQLNVVDAAIARAAQGLTPVAEELVPIDEACGRVLSQALIADRDSPALNVSAMDGYAVRIADVGQAPLSVAAVSPAGRPPVELPAGQAVQLFTGAPVPDGADCVVRREDTHESPGQVVIRHRSEELRIGQNIRYRGENIRQGQPVLPAGTQVTAATMGALVAFGGRHISVRRLISVSLLASGDELVEPGQAVQPWQIRNSNAPTLRSWLARLSWTRVVSQGKVADSLAASQTAIASALEQSDVLILTGGVSAGDTDYIPSAIESLGGHILFHRLPIRPGKPVLVGTLAGKLILGLPGNPVSAAVTALRIAQPLLGRLAGRLPEPELHCQLTQYDAKRLDLTWYRLVAWHQAGLQLVESQGSGDLVSLALSHGFIEVPPGGSGSGPWRTWLW
ncbi:MAG: molybdopterin molybdotransferase MoeA [Pirellulaceae bacterium]|nr:molybdopterin molybdotransferase MoeA [Pirellulaceae bacterium]